MDQSRIFTIRIRGDLACFTIPALSVERVSAPFITPSAARGLLEAILWKPAIKWVIREIQILAPIRYIQFRRNEVNSRLSVSSVNSISKSSEPLNYFADDDRAQRNTVALRDVDYAVSAQMIMTKRRGPEDSIRKFEEMFERRLEKGQQVTQPVLGCREFPAIVEKFDGTVNPIQDSQDFGVVLHDLEYGSSNRPYFFRALMRSGRITVPDIGGHNASQ